MLHVFVYGKSLLAGAFKSMHAFRVYLHHRRRKWVTTGRRCTITRTHTIRHAYSLGGSAGNVEPLVDARVNGRWGLLLVLGKVELARVSAVIAVRHGGVGAVNHSSAYRFTSSNAEKCNSQADIPLRSLARHHPLPRLRALADDIHGVLPVLALA